MSYNQQDKELFLDFLDRHFFQGWKAGDENSNSLEFILTQTCNTKCSYCYYKNFGNELNPVSCFDWERTISNIELTLKWAASNKYKIPSIEIFSGEFFNTPHWQRILDILLNESSSMIVIPSNCTFLFNDEKTELISDYLNRYRNRLFISMSIDGKFLDNETRPLRNGKKYTDDFYERAFDFSVRHHLGMHPMIGAKGINKWIENYEWLLGMYEKRGLTRKQAIGLTYLLEVRNPDWRKEDMASLAKLMIHLVKLIHSEYPDPEECVQALMTRGKNCNILGSVLCHTPRGLGCSFQTTLFLMPNSMELALCHRLSYKGYKTATLHLEEDGATDLDIQNPLEGMMLYGFDQKKIYKCSNCDIREICVGPCLGVNYEVNRDPMVPVDTVCELEHWKVYGIIKGIKEEGLIPYVLRVFEREGNRNIFFKNYFNQIKEISDKV